MGILDKLKPHPRWKHADPAVRLEAVGELDDAVELALLAETDLDARVRRAAVARIDDPVVLSRVAEGDTDADAREQATERLFALATTGLDGSALAAVEAIKDPKRLSAVAKSAAPEAVCLWALARTTDGRALSSIARQASHASVAAAALARLTDAAFWLDIALNAEHKDVALAAFEQATAGSMDLDALRSIEARAKDKAVSKRARARIQQIEEAEAARAAAAEERLRQQKALCEAVERLAGVADAGAARAELAQLTAAWSGLGDVDEDDHSRFTRATVQADAAIMRRQLEAEAATEAARQRAEAVATCEALCARVETLDQEDNICEQLIPIEEEWRSLLPLLGPSPEADRLAERFAVAVAACRKRHELGAELAERRASLAALVVEAESLPSHDDAAAAAARWTVLSREARGLTALLSDAAHQALSDLVARLEAVGQVFTGRDAKVREAAARAQQDLAAGFQRLVERAARVAEADTITLREGERLMRDIKAGLDAVASADASHDLQAATNRLRRLQEQVAPRVRDLREMDEWRRFANGQQQEKLIAMAEAIVASLKADEDAGKESDLAATARALRELHAKWHEVAEAPRNVAQRLWDRFRTATDEIRSRCAVHFAKLREERAVNIQQKAAIVEEAEALAASTDWAKAAARYRELQEAWKAAGPLPREPARTLYARLRTASNAFFARRREDLADRKKVWSENLARKDAMCARVEELVNSREWDAAAGEIKRLQAEWKTVGPVRRKQSDAVWTRFRAAADAFFERYHHRHEIALAGKLAEREAMVVEIEGLAGAENGHVPADVVAQVQNLRTTWNRAVPIPVAEMKTLTSRWQTALAHLVEKRPEAFAGTDLDPRAVVRKMEKLVSRVESLLDGQDVAPANGGLSSAELLAARLRSALASNAMGGRAHEGVKWRQAFDTVRDAQDAWRRLAPVVDDDARALEAKFTAACRRVADEARRHGVDAHRPDGRSGKPAHQSGSGGQGPGRPPGARGPKRPRRESAAV